MLRFILLSFIGLAACQAIVEKPESSDCCYLTGKWRNQHGSMMVLNHTEDGVLTGEYMTAVESTHGSSKGEQFIHGRVGQGRPTTFGFTVAFKGGKSSASWSGQYHLCNGKESLLTTWILTSVTETCQEGWMATRIGQDEFVRVNQTKPFTEPEFFRKYINRKSTWKINKRLRQRAWVIRREKQRERKLQRMTLKSQKKGKGQKGKKERKQQRKERKRSMTRGKYSNKA